MNWASNPCAYMHANNLCNQEANNVHVEEQGNHTIAVARLLLLLGPRGMHLVTAKEKPQLSLLSNYQVQRSWQTGSSLYHGIHSHDYKHQFSQAVEMC